MDDNCYTYWFYKIKFYKIGVTKGPSVKYRVRFSNLTIQYFDTQHDNLACKCLKLMRKNKGKNLMTLPFKKAPDLKRQCHEIFYLYFFS